jgi:hypothetical protein
MNNVRLIYRGGGSHIPGLPGRDLNEDDIAQYADYARTSTEIVIKALVDSGLYKYPPKPKTPKTDEDDT